MASVADECGGRRTPQTLKPGCRRSQILVPLEHASLSDGGESDVEEVKPRAM